MATIGALVFEMSANVARLQQDMSKARSTVDSAMQGIKSAADLAKTALGALGVVLSVDAFRGMVSGAIESMDALHRLNLQTGITVETLSALRPIAKAGGTDLDTLAGMVNKLEKNMLAFAQTGAGKAADAFKQLGYSQEQVSAGLKNMDTFLPEFAKRLIATGVGGEQAGLAMQLMAKGGAAALPVLNELAKAGELHAKVTTEQAEAAHRFEASMVKLGEESNRLKISFANALLPSLNDITQAMLDARKAGDGFWGSMHEGAKKAMQAMLGWNTAGDLNDVSKKIVKLTDDYLALEAAQEKGVKSGSRAVQMQTLKAEIDALIKKRDILEGIAKLEQPAKEEKKKQADLAELGGKGGMDKATADAWALQKKQVEQFNHDYWESIQERNEVEQRLIAEGQIAAAEEYRRARELELKQMLEFIDAENDRAIAQGKAYLDALKKGAKETSSAARELGLTFSSAFEDAVLHGEKLSKVLQGLAKDVQRIFFRKTVTEPLADLASSVFKNFNWRSLLPSFDIGTPYVPQDMVAMVHKGEAIIPASQNTGGMGGGVTVNQSIYIDSRSDVATIRAAMDEAQRRAQAAILQSINRGGVFAQAVGIA